ncbi:unnamed protein product [Dibothriocephalus latus]|uniref:Uncharacterized protein n=1 Tax=Dibothriocephalus latus TaxID=60516 RepID=A0A3P6QSJ0_DIBLA|nr:unnamed protein product [Dibothriocephalus latus]
MVAERNSAMPDVDWQNRMYTLVSRLNAGITLVNDRLAVLEEYILRAYKNG